VTGELNLDVCGVAESGLVDRMYFMEAELYNSEWSWYGKERKGRRGGGLGFLVKKVLKPRIVRASKNCNLLWLEVATDSRWFLAVVYLIPYDESANEKTLLIQSASAPRTIARAISE